MRIEIPDDITRGRPEDGIYHMAALGEPMGVRGLLQELLPQGQTLLLAV